MGLVWGWGYAGLRVRTNLSPKQGVLPSPIAQGRIINPKP